MVVLSRSGQTGLGVYHTVSEDNTERQATTEPDAQSPKHHSAGPPGASFHPSTTRL